MTFDKSDQGSTKVNRQRKKPSAVNVDIRHSKPAIAAKRGRPFQVGEDPRRHKFGRKSLCRAAFIARLNNALTGGEGPPEELAQVLWKHARAGRPWAISELLDRICGRPTQPLEPSLAENVSVFKLEFGDPGVGDEGERS